MFGFFVVLLGGLARCAVLLHLACAFVFVVAVALDAHPVARSWVPKQMEMVFDAQNKLQCGLVLPWGMVLVGATAAKILWVACAVALSSVRRMCNCCCGSNRQSTAVKRSVEEGKDNGPPKMIESAKAPHNPTSHHLRRRTYPKIM